MARVIDAEKYMELLKEQYLHHKSLGNSQAEKAWQGAIQLLYDMPTLTPPNEWVSVEERLPEESDGMVLFTNGKAVTSGYRNHMFRMSGEEGIYAPAIRKGGGYMRVTHWMPLPAPPDRRPPEGEA